MNVTCAEELDCGQLFLWQKPEDFDGVVSYLMNRLGTHGLFTTALSGAQSIREAWILSRVARALNASCCRLMALEFPDAQIRMHDGEIVDMELTEVLDEKRRRGDEYRSPSRLKHVDHATLMRNHKFHCAWLTQAVKNKLIKSRAGVDVPRYAMGKAFDLVVYDNITIFKNADLNSIHDTIDVVQQNAYTPIRNIWRVTYATVEQIWPDIRSFPVPNWWEDAKTL